MEKYPQMPILKVNKILIVSIQEDLTDNAAVQLQQDILDKIYLTKVIGILIDISLMDIVDSFLGRVIFDTVRMASLLGAKIVLVGMKPSVSITLIEFGLDISNIDTAMDIKEGMEKLEQAMKSSVVGENNYSISPGEEKDGIV